MPDDPKLFRNSTEAITAYKMSLEEDGHDLFETRVWRAFSEQHPGLDPQAVERVLRSNWDELETLRGDQALDRLAMLAGGRRSPAMPEEPKPKDIWHKDTPLTLCDIIYKRREGRRVVGEATKETIFNRRRAEAPLENAQRQLAEIRNKERRPT